MEEQIKLFLTAIALGDSLPVASRAQDRARQKCRRSGLAVFHRDTWTWAITDAGRAAITTAGQE